MTLINHILAFAWFGCLLLSLLGVALQMSLYGSKRGSKEDELFDKVTFGSVGIALLSGVLCLAWVFTLPRV